MSTTLYQAEWDNGGMYSDHSHQVIGTFTTPELAMAYCVAWNQKYYERQEWDPDWAPFHWEGDWKHTPAVHDGVIQYEEHWTHPEMTGTFMAQQGGFVIAEITLDPEPPAPAEKE